jgi:hypothetical protein
MSKRPIILGLLLLACEDYRGQNGHFCRPDGSCVSERLVCKRAPVYWGLAVSEPTCVLREP